MQVHYIDLELEDALQKKWEAGCKTHRRKPTDPFTGDPAQELFEELLDAIHYVRELQDRGAEMPGFEITLTNMARWLQDQKRQLRKR